jgi:hypothetical protein
LHDLVFCCNVKLNLLPVAKHDAYHGEENRPQLRIPGIQLRMKRTMVRRLLTQNTVTVAAAASKVTQLMYSGTNMPAR